MTTLLTLESCYKLFTTSQILRVSTSLSQSVSKTCDKSAERYIVTSLWSQACCNVWNWQHCYKLVHRLVTSLEANKLVTSLWEIWPCIIKRIKSAVIKFQIENISSQDRKQCFQAYPAEIVPPVIPERLKGFLKANLEVYRYRKLASAWSRTQMTPTKNGTSRNHEHIYCERS